MWGKGKVSVSKRCAYVGGNSDSIVAECDHAVDEEIVGISEHPRGALGIDVHGDGCGHIDELALLWLRRRTERHDKPTRGEWV